MKNDESIWGKIRHSWVEYSHAVYVLMVISGLYFTGMSEAHEFKTRAALIAILVYFVILLLFLAYFIHVYSRKARYAEAMACAHSASHTLRDASAYLEHCEAKREQYENTKFQNYIGDVLESTVRAFSIVTGTNCRASIKILGGGSSEEGGSKESLYVRTFARDHAAARDCKDKDKNEGNKHLIVKNTDFNLILNNGYSYFFCNNIGFEEYTNSSKKEYGGNYPYSSVMVFPIRREYRPEESGTTIDKFRVLGFLAIDSPSRKVFIKKYDVQLGATISDHLYVVLNQWSIVKSKEK